MITKYRVTFDRGKGTPSFTVNPAAENPGLWNSLKGESMELIKFIMWLIAGAVIGWFASRIVSIEHRRMHKPMPNEDRSSKKS